MSLLGLVVALSCILVAVCQGPPGNCNDCIIYDISAQSKCQEITRRATRDCKWAAGLDMMVDQVAARGKVIAYQIKWFNGKWSEWYVPGYNDMDDKFNPSAKKCGMPYKKDSLRRRWAYFVDHTHKYIICKPNRRG